MAAEFRDTSIRTRPPLGSNFIRARGREVRGGSHGTHWLDDAIVASADECGRTGGRGVGSERRAGRAEEPGHAVGGTGSRQDRTISRSRWHEAFARFPVDEHFEVAGRSVSALSVVAGTAVLFGGGQGAFLAGHAGCDWRSGGQGRIRRAGTTVHVRVAEHEDKIYIDLCNDAWQVLKISTSGWRVLDRVTRDVPSREGHAAAAVPVAGGSVAELRRFVHMEDGEWILFVSWLVAALRP